MNDSIRRTRRTSSAPAWLGAILLTVLTACGGHGGDVLGTPTLAPPPPSGVAPTVSATSPLADATGVPTNTRSFSAAFSHAMDPATLNATTFTLACPVGNGLTGTVSYLSNGNVALLTLPSTTTLPANTICTATIGTGAKDTVGVALAAPFVWRFTTGAGADTTAPTVAATVPARGATAVATNSGLSVEFSESMDPSSITTSTVLLACPAAAPVSGTVGYAISGNVATFTPTGTLPINTTCTATVTTGVRDGAGNALAATYTWTFTTGTSADTTPPAVSSTVPMAGATGVALNATISVGFSEPMDPQTITTSTLTLACPAGTPVTGTVAYAASGYVATFTPTVALAAATTCTATVSTGAKDVAGNALAAPYAWTFTTGATADATAPTVVSNFPVAGATGVPVNERITATFSESMKPSTIGPTTFLVDCPTGTPVAGTVAYAVNGNVATFTPAGPLPASTVCRATVTTGATDLAGNALAAPFVWTFTTGVAPDTVPPTVTGTNPADLAVGVCVNKSISATFSEPMDPLTITNATFTLQQLGTPVAGTVTYDSVASIATFRPSSNLIGTPSTLYTVTIRGGVSGVKDLAGNALAVDRVSSFTTNASTCTTAPALGAAAPFGSFGGNATLTNDGLDTVINGDVGVNAASTTITGLHDAGGNVYTVTPNNNGAVNGLIYTQTAPPGSPAGVAVTQARGDAMTAFNSLSPANLAGGIDVSNLAQCPTCGGAGGGADELAGRTLPPGIYRSTTGTFDIGGPARTVASLVLDAGGDPNAVWVFQSAAGTGTLRVGLTGPATPSVPIMVLLINGAQSKNVFWYAPAGATIGTGSTVAGTILADATITISTTGGTPPSAVVTTINGRAIVLTAGVTMTNTVVNRPAP